MKKRIFIISLERNRARRMSILQQVSRLGQEFEILDALDASLTRSEFLKSPVNRSLSSGEIACYFSHLNVLRRIVDYGLDAAVVLEDDFKLAANTPFELRDVWDYLPPGADHVQLHSFKDRFYPPYRTIDGSTEFFNRVRPTNVMTVGYIVSRRLASFVLAEHSVPCRPIDLVYTEISRWSADRFRFFDCKEGLITVEWAFRSTVDRK